MSMIAFYTGASGMRAFQNALDVSAHNMANIQTTGYKARRASFQDLLYSRMNTNVAGNHLVGHGVKQEAIDQLMGQQGLDQTMQPLDFALVGDGFFVVDNRGRTEYTRNGAFNLSIENGVPTLVTNDGAYVLDHSGNNITLTVNPDGSYNTTDLHERLAVVRFPNQWGLSPENNARYTVSTNSGDAQPATPGDPNAASPVELVQGALEYSGVNMGDEMIGIIMAQRAFQMNSRVLQTADQIADEVNNLR